MVAAVDWAADVLDDLAVGGTGDAVMVAACASAASSPAAAVNAVQFRTLL